ncbi:MAG: hypothetical protein ACM3QX_09710 [Syntrophomonadaceae bacterium]
MDEFNLDELKMLTQEREWPSISIYIPTSRRGTEVIQASIRLKNHLRDIERQLKEKDVNPVLINEILTPAQDIVGDEFFWNHQEDSLAIFLAKGESHMYRLSVSIDEKSNISSRFYIKPLIPALSQMNAFYIMFLDRKNLKLFRANPFGYKEVELKNVVTNMDDALQLDESEQNKFRDSEGGLHRASLYFGPGNGTDDAKKDKDILRFFQMADKGIFNAVKGENLPMVLSGVEYLLPIFKSASSYPNIADEGVAGGTWEPGMNEIHRHALEIMRPYIEKKEKDALSKYYQYSAGEQSSDDIGQILQAAFSNRVDSLFVNTGEQVPGTFNPDTYEVNLAGKSEEGEDLVELAVVQTLLHGGNVYQLPYEKMPDGKPLAAVFRY